MIDKAAIRQHFDAIAPDRTQWYKRNHLYHQQVLLACRPYLTPDSRILELGSSTGDLLHDLQPAFGVGVDLSPISVETARQQFPDLHFVRADIEALPDVAPLDRPFDLIVLSDLVGYLDDIQHTLEALRRLTHSKTHIVISHWNWMWEGALHLAERLGIKAPDLAVRHNWLSPESLSTLLNLAGYEPVQTLNGLLFPFHIPVISPILNAFSRLPVIGRFSLVRMVIARPLPEPDSRPARVTVVIPTRNEKGNIEAAVLRTPEMGTHTELLFIDGNSTDGTVEEIQRQIKLHPERDIKFMPQVPPASTDSDAPPNLMLKLGKGDAVRKAFAAASGDILMILDSDLTVPPEDMPKFYTALVSGKGDFINGSRLVYPQEEKSMRFINRMGNVFFSFLFTWLLGQTITDTLCGTKALRKTDYETIVANRHVFGDFDPFGDFDLIFGAAWIGLKMIDLPVRYRARTYGESKVRVSLHGPLLGQMSWIAFLRFKLFPLLGGEKPVRSK